MMLTLRHKHISSGLQKQTTLLIRSLSHGHGHGSPPSADQMPRPAGIASMMRLPVVQSTEGLDVAFVGVPMDIGTSNRPGTRFGPRQIRTESVLLREHNKDTGAWPFSSLRVADAGDVSCTPYNLPEACAQIQKSFQGYLATGCKVLAMGGDHTITYPILQAVKEKYGPVALIHVDAHSDTSESMFGAKIAHGTPFRRAVEEGLLIPNKVIQIGLRGTGYGNDYDWPLSQGFRLIPAKDCFHKSLAPLMEDVKKQFGTSPVYFSFDIDALDPAFAPGTGTPEIGGLTSVQALEIIRGARGLNIIGGDLVEVSPPYDFAGTTSLTAANLLFEMLCILPGVRYETVAI